METFFTKIENHENTALAVAIFIIMCCYALRGKE